MPLPRYVEATRVPTELPAFQHGMDKDLRVPLERQQQNQWCWAAVAVGIAAHYAAPKPPRWEQQCSFVNDFLEGANCCGPEGARDRCNRARAISRALEKGGHYATYTDTVDFATLRHEIDSGRPVVLRIARADRGKTHYHFVVVDAYKASSGRTGNVAIRNPDEPRRDIISHATLYSKFYGKDWKWEYTFFTKPAGPVDQSGEPLMDVTSQESFARERVARGGHVPKDARAT